MANFISPNHQGSLEEFLELNPSFKSWLEKSNDLSKSKIETKYEAAEKELLEKYKQAADKSKKAEIKSQMSSAKDEKSKKINELKKADKKIEKFKKFRTTFKLCSDAVDLANTEEGEKISKDFLGKYEKILNERKSSANPAEKYESVDLDKQTINVALETEKILKEKRKGKKIESYIKNGEVWYRELLSIFGKSQKPTARESQSAKFDLVGENDLSDWMGKVIKDESKLADIIIPCSHDSGCYSTAPISSSDLVGKAAQTQTVNFRGQIRAGIRYFDLRMNLENGIPVMAHDIVNGAPASQAIRQVLKFAKAHPNEILIIEISHTSKECLEKFYKLPVVKELQKLNYNYSGKIGNITVGEMRRSKKNILMFKESSSTLKDIYNGSIREERNEQVIIENELKNLEKNWNNNKTSRTLHKITPTHCATKEDLVSKGTYWIPLSNTEKFKKPYEQLLKNEKFKNLSNIVSYDDAIGNFWFTKELIKLNAQRQGN